MNEEHVELLSRSLDEQLSPAEQARLDHALADSLDLRELAQDWGVLKETAVHQIEPPAPAVFQQLKKRVDRRYGWKRGIRLPIWSMPLAATAAILFLVFQPQTVTPPTEPEPVLSELEQVQAQIESARERFGSAIARMERLAVSRIEALPEDQAVTFQRNLDLVNLAVAECERIASENPLAPEAHLALEEAYAAKVKVLELILGG